MSKVNLDAALKDAEREGHISGGDTFKVKEGANRIRLVDGPLANPETYKGEKRFKWLTRVIDRVDGQVKLYFMPHVLFKLLRDLQQSEDYGFEDVPMGYDLTINAKGAGTREVEYSLVPARKNTALTADELNALDALKPLKEVQALLRAKSEEKQPAETKGFDPDEVPI